MVQHERRYFCFNIDSLKGKCCSVQLFMYNSKKHSLYVKITARKVPVNSEKHRTESDRKRRRLQLVGPETAGQIPAERKKRPKLLRKDTKLKRKKRHKLLRKDTKLKRKKRHKLLRKDTNY